MKREYTLDEMRLLFGSDVTEDEKSGDFVVTQYLGDIKMVIRSSKTMYVGMGGVPYIAGRTATLPVGPLIEPLGDACLPRDAIVATANEVEFQDNEVYLHHVEPKEAKYVYLMAMCPYGRYAPKGCREKCQMAQHYKAVKTCRLLPEDAQSTRETLNFWVFEIENPAVKSMVDAVVEAQTLAEAAGEIYLREKDYYRARVISAVRRLDRFVPHIKMQMAEDWLTLSLSKDKPYTFFYDEKNARVLEKLGLALMQCNSLSSLLLLLANLGEVLAE